MKKCEDSEVKQVLSVGELAKRSGVAISAIHFYEAKGLLFAFRNEQNQRQYPRGMLRILSLLKVAQKLGFSLEEIQNMFKSFPTKHKPTEADWQRLSKLWRAELDSRIKLLERLRNQLDRCIGCGCLSMKDCPLRNQNDKLARRGAGAHLL
ncbi:redox-sensitive transcriptional activator SoxR [Bdellovibrio bacteriovorus]|uniref:redox-sensitive transcriptional activator SoxR n=1 Tax=Bdellovibrio TaxID=958 RepID=UPI0035A885F9